MYWFLNRMVTISVKMITLNLIKYLVQILTALKLNKLSLKLTQILILFKMLIRAVLWLTIPLYLKLLYEKRQIP